MSQKAIEMIGFLKKYRWDEVFKFPVPGEHGVPLDYTQGIKNVIFVGYETRYVVDLSNGLCTWIQEDGGDMKGGRDIAGMQSESKRWIPVE